MNSTAFVLGREPACSSTEILYHLCPTQNQILHLSTNVLVLDLPNSFSPDACIEKLGGTVKIAQVLTDQPISEMQRTTTLKNFCVSEEGKITFGISVYPWEKKMPTLPIQTIRKIALEVKRALQEDGRSVRVIENREIILNTATLQANAVPKRAKEFILWYTPDGKMYVGSTRSYQPFSSFSLRDYGRPKRDMKQGMLPPKLARMLIHFSGASKYDTLLDPFCGSGTIVTEALLMGFTKIFGTDLSPKAVQDTQKNVEWIRSHIQPAPQKNVSKPILKQSDVRNLGTHFTKHSIDAIITEPYLGPSTIRTGQNLLAVKKELESLYSAAFTEFKNILTVHGRVVCIVPAFRKNKTDWEYLESTEKIKQIGFKHVPLPETVITNLKEFLTPRGSLFYARPEQVVGREILLLENS